MRGARGSGIRSRDRGRLRTAAMTLAIIAGVLIALGIGVSAWRTHQVRTSAIEAFRGGGALDDAVPDEPVIRLLSDDGRGVMLASDERYGIYEFSFIGSVEGAGRWVASAFARSGWTELGTGTQSEPGSVRTFKVGDRFAYVTVLDGAVSENRECMVLIQMQGNLG